MWFAPSYLGVVLFLFGIASTYLAYVISLFATSQLAAFAFVAGGQAIFLLIYFLLSVFLQNLSASLADMFQAISSSSRLPMPKVSRQI